MAAGIYLQSDLNNAVNPLIHGKVSTLTSFQNLANLATRIVMSEVDLRGTIRNALLTPSLFDNVYDYALPSDIKDDKIVDIIPAAM